MARRELPGQQAFELFEKPKQERTEYTVPCPIREWCGAYHCETYGCSGERGWCARAQHKAFDITDCPLELKRTMGNKKSFCAAWDKWTNCREVGHCTYERQGG